MSLALQQLAREIIDMSHRHGVTLKAPSTKNLEIINNLQAFMLEQPQVDIPVSHLLHAGMYHRTVKIPAGVGIVGALVKIATTLIVSGDATIITDGDALYVNGYTVLGGMKGRKQIIKANSDTWMTMVFPTDATTIGEAEREFTDDYEHLQNNRGTL
jgi:hypothetical protein